jgi:hypothetical protein
MQQVYALLLLSRDKRYDTFRQKRTLEYRLNRTLHFRLLFATSAPICNASNSDYHLTQRTGLVAGRN